MEYSTVKNDTRFCPFCEQERSVFFVRTVQTEGIHGQNVKNKQEFYHCPICGGKFGEKKHNISH